MSHIIRVLCLIMLFVSFHAMASDRVQVREGSDWCSGEEGTFSINLVWFRCDELPDEMRNVKPLHVGAQAYITPWSADDFIENPHRLSVSSESGGTIHIAIKKTPSGFELWDMTHD